MLPAAACWVSLFLQPGKGDQEPGRPADDLVFVVSEKPHERFTRSGNDLVGAAAAPAAPAITEDLHPVLANKQLQLRAFNSIRQSLPAFTASC